MSLSWSTRGTVPVLAVVIPALSVGLLISVGPVSSPAGAATTGMATGSPAVVARPPAKAVPGRRIVIRVKGDRLAQRAKVTLVGYSGRATGFRRTVLVKNVKRLRQLPTGRYKVKARSIYHDGKVARHYRIPARRLLVTRSKGARTVITYARDSWARRASEAAAVARARPGRVSFALADKNGRIVAAYDSGNHVSSASVIKALFLAAYLRSDSVANRALTRSEKDRLTPMITKSWNSPATQTRNLVGMAAVDRVARDAGMTHFHQRWGWGSSQITAADMARFFARVENLIPQRHRGYAMWLFSHITPQQQWGIPKAAPSAWTWHVKGGWINRVVNQAGLVTRGPNRVSLAILIEGTPGSGTDVHYRPDSVPGPATIRKVARQLIRPGLKYL